MSPNIETTVIYAWSGRSKHFVVYTHRYTDRHGGLWLDGIKSINWKKTGCLGGVVGAERRGAGCGPPSIATHAQRPRVALCGCPEAARRGERRTIPCEALATAAALRRCWMVGSLTRTSRKSHGSTARAAAATAAAAVAAATAAAVAAARHSAAAARPSAAAAAAAASVTGQCARPHG